MLTDDGYRSRPRGEFLAGRNYALKIVNGLALVKLPAIKLGRQSYLLVEETRLAPQV